MSKSRDPRFAARRVRLNRLNLWNLIVSFGFSIMLGLHVVKYGLQMRISTFFENGGSTFWIMFGSVVALGIALAITSALLLKSYLRALRAPRVPDNQGATAEVDENESALVR